MSPIIIQQCEHRLAEYVRCPKCGWQGRKNELINGCCPRCSSKELDRM